VKACAYGRQAENFDHGRQVSVDNAHDNLEKTIG
jgi:hypothetical protein